MKNVIFFIVVLFIVIVIIKLCIRNEWRFYYCSCPQKRIGNYLSEYFTDISFQLRNSNIATITHKYGNDLNMPEKVDLQYLNISHSDLIFPYKTQIYTKHSPLSQWRLPNNILSGISPIIRSILQEYIPKPNKNYTNTIIVHLRMSDVPFIRHKFYHFLKDSWFHEAFKHIKENIGNKKMDVTILCNNKHRMEVKYTIWKQYLTHHENMIKNIPWIQNVSTIFDGNVLDDFSIMLNCPFLISSGSSMATLAALGSNKMSIFPTPQDFAYNNKYEKTNIIYLNHGRLDHKLVKDYNDVPNVLSLLSK